MNIFEDLKESLDQAIEIQQGRIEVARVARFEVADVKAIRATLKVSQREFAQALGTSVDTIKSWETKRRNPTGLAANVLAVIKNNPSFYKELSTHHQTV
jgi:DNA-binding transcriptional regulator YiaG